MATRRSYESEAEHRRAGRMGGDAEARKRKSGGKASEHKMAEQHIHVHHHHHHHESAKKAPARKR